MNTSPNIRFEDWEAEQMQDPEFRAAVEALEPVYQAERLRIMRGLTQKQLTEWSGSMTRKELRQELLTLEEKHGMKSEDFYSRRQAGEAPAPLDGLRWALLYELWQDGYPVL